MNIPTTNLEVLDRVQTAVGKGTVLGFAYNSADMRFIHIVVILDGEDGRKIMNPTHIEKLDKDKQSV